MNTEVELYGTKIKTEVIALIEINNKFEAFSRGALNEMLHLLDHNESRFEILKTFSKTKNEMIHICNMGIKLIEDES